MKKSRLKILLSDLKGFEEFDNSNLNLEQYSTSPEVAAEVLNTAFVSGDIEGKIIFDLGCGTGIFAIGSAILNSKNSVGIEKDKRAIEVARKNKESIEEKLDRELNVGFRVKDVRDIEIEEENMVNTVIMNPPFGLKNRDKNLLFLRKGVQIGGVVYAVQHSPDKRREKTRKFIKDYLSSFSREGKILQNFEMRIPRTYKFHNKKVENIEVDLWRIK